MSAIGDQLSYLRDVPAERLPPPATRGGCAGLAARQSLLQSRPISR